MNRTGKDLLEIEKSLWIGGSDLYRQHLDETSLAVFPGMVAVYPREEIAGMADQRRWTEVAIDMKGMIEPQPGMAILCYEARTQRASGEP